MKYWGDAVYDFKYLLMAKYTLPKTGSGENAHQKFQVLWKSVSSEG